MTRTDGRAFDQLRETSITTGVARFAEGSALIKMGNTHVLCTATIEERVQQFLKGSGKGWVTAEYAMLPRSTAVRTPRETTPRGRSQEIQRLVGRCLRAAVVLEKLGERTITIDCDVLQADGGTRTAAITGGYVALYQALHYLTTVGVLRGVPVREPVAAVSVGLGDEGPLLDLCYEEDAVAKVDFNVAMLKDGRLVEVQGTAEGAPFTREQLGTLLDLATKGMTDLFRVQSAAVRSMG